MYISADHDGRRSADSVSERRIRMKIMLVNDKGEVEYRSCRKIEPVTLLVGKIIVDEDEVIDLRDVIAIVG